MKLFETTFKQFQIFHFLLSSEVATPPGKAASMEAKPASVKLDPAFNQLISSLFLVQIARWNSWSQLKTVRSTAPPVVSEQSHETWDHSPAPPWRLHGGFHGNIPTAPITLTRSRSKPLKMVLKTGMLGEALQDSHEKDKLVNQPLERIDCWRLYLSRLCTLNLEQQGSMNLEVDKSSIDIQTSLNLGLALLMT